MRPTYELVEVLIPTPHKRYADMLLPCQIFIPGRQKKRWNILIYYYEDASVTRLALILPLTSDWWMTGFNKTQSTTADLMKFEMQKYVEVCVLYGMGYMCVRAHVCMCVSVCAFACVIKGGWGEAWGIMLMKNKFQKPVLPLLRPELQPLHFNVRCSLHYLWCFTPQNRGLPLPLPHQLRVSLSLSLHPHSNHKSWVSLHLYTPPECVDRKDSGLPDGSGPAGIWWSSKPTQTIAKLSQHCAKLHL